MNNYINELLLSGGNKRIGIEFPDDNISDIRNIHEKSSSYERITCADTDLNFGAYSATFTCTADNVPDITGKHAKVYWEVYEPSTGSNPDIVVFVKEYILDGYVASAEIQTDRASRKIVIYDKLKDVLRQDISKWYNQQFVKRAKTEYKGSWRASARYNENETFYYNEKYYRNVSKDTDLIGQDGQVYYVQDLLVGKTPAQIAGTDLEAYYQELSYYDPYERVTKQLSVLIRNFVENVANITYSASSAANAVNGNMTVSYTPVTSLTGEEFLKAYCTMNGCFCYINGDGVFEHAYLGTETIDFTDNYEVFNTTYAEYQVKQINEVVFYDRGGKVKVSYNSGAQDRETFYIQNIFSDYTTTTHALRLLEVLSSISYTPANISAVIGLEIPVGARITFTTHENETINTYCLKQVMSGFQMINQTISAQGNKKRGSFTVTVSQEQIDDDLGNSIDDNRAQSGRVQAEANNSEARAIQNIQAHPGLYQTVVQAQGGGVVYYLHDKPTIVDSQNIIEISSESIRLSSDGGEHWTTELKIDGEVIARILRTDGVEAEWINSGTLEAMTLHGTTGEIGGWTIKNTSLYAEYESELNKDNYQVLFKTPKDSAYEECNVDIDNGYFEMDAENKKIVFTPSESGTCKITIKSNRIQYGEYIRNNYKSNYPTASGCDVDITATKYWNEGYTETETKSNQNVYIQDLTIPVEGARYSQHHASGGMERDADYVIVETELTFNNVIADHEYTLEYKFAPYDYGDSQYDYIEYFDDDIPDGFSQDMVLALKNSRGELLACLYGNGEWIIKQGELGGFLSIKEGAIETFEEGNKYPYIRMEKDKLHFIDEHADSAMYSDNGIIKVDGSLEPKARHPHASYIHPKIGRGTGYVKEEGVDYILGRTGNIGFFMGSFQSLGIAQNTSENILTIDISDMDCWSIGKYSAEVITGTMDTCRTYATIDSGTISLRQYGSGAGTVTWMDISLMWVCWCD